MPSTLLTIAAPGTPRSGAIPMARIAVEERTTIGISLTIMSLVILTGLTSAIAPTITRMLKIFASHYVPDGYPGIAPEWRK